MDIRHLFRRPGVTPSAVARAACVTRVTASRWKAGNRRPNWEHVVRLHAAGIVTDDDLRAAGLAIPRREAA